MDIADRLRALRKELALTQEGLGKHVGMTRTEVNHIERRRRRLSGHDVRMRFAAGLGLPVTVLDSYLAGTIGVDLVAAAAREKLGVTPSAPLATGTDG